LFSFPAISSPFMCMNKSCSTGGKILLSLLLLGLLSPKVFPLKKKTFSFLRPSLKNQYTKKRTVLQDYPRKNCCCIVSGNFEGIPQTGETAGIFHRKNFCE
ncbi:hypothetical protein, partial [[Ruminococcus] torques]|uniref:hypothetical protein n=2 Tax=[Ruminococcus] torques TaxID=33039 RepID=UPI003AB5D0B4